MDASQVLRANLLYLYTIEPDNKGRVGLFVGLNSAYPFN